MSDLLELYLKLHDSVARELAGSKDEKSYNIMLLMLMFDKLFIKQIISAEPVAEGDEMHDIILTLSKYMNVDMFHTFKKKLYGGGSIIDSILTKLKQVFMDPQTHEFVANIPRMVGKHEKFLDELQFASSEEKKDFAHVKRELITKTQMLEENKDKFINSPTDFHKTFLPMVQELNDMSLQSEDVSSINLASVSKLSRALKVEEEIAKLNAAITFVNDLDDANGIALLKYRAIN